MADNYTRYYTHQIGGGVGDEQFMQLRIPRVYQRGRGVGGIFSTIWRFLQPVLKSCGSYVASEMVDTGADILKGIGQQKPMKTILKDRSMQIVDNLRDKAANKIKSMAGDGLKRKKLANTKPINTGSKKKLVQLVGHRRPTKKKKSNKNSKIKPARILDIFS